MKTISSVCSEANQAQSQWSFEPATEDDMRKAHHRLIGASSSSAKQDTFDANLLLGVLGQETTNNKDAPQHLCTFYLAYSTWQGEKSSWDKIALD